MALFRDPLPIATTQKMFEKWVDVVKRHECGSIVSLPRSDRHYRIAQFLHGISTKVQNEIQWVSVSFQSFATENWDEFLKRLEENLKPQKRIVFLVKDAEWLLTAAPHLIPNLQDYVLQSYRKVSFLFFFERNILDSKTAHIITSCPSLFQNVFIQPLYQRLDILHFIRHLEDLYGFLLKGNEREKIWQQTCGYIWLTTEAVRNAHATGKLSFDHPAMRFRLQAVWEGFNHQEQQLLLAISRNSEIPIHSDETCSYLLQTGLIAKEGDSYVIRVPILSRYIAQISSEQHQLTIDNNLLSVNHVPVDSIFSERERVLLAYLLTHQGEVIPRDTVATVLWGENVEENYTDWGLDQAMRRLRKRLEQLGIPKQFIKTVKGKGVYVNP